MAYTLKDDDDNLFCIQITMCPRLRFSRTSKKHLAPWPDTQTFRLRFSASVIKLINSFLSNRPFSVADEDEMSTPRERQAGVCHKVPSCPLPSTVCIQTIPSKSLASTSPSLLTTDRDEGYVLRKPQRGLTSMQSWCVRWNITNGDNIQTICFSHR